jgi:hypothetical protein
MSAQTLIDKIALWEAASAKVSKTAHKAIEILNQAGIPILVTGGLAVIAHGYDVSTRDVDLIVPDFETAHQLMLSHGYAASVEVPIGVIDAETKVRVDILPGGKSLSLACPVNFPMPTEFGQQYVTLPELISTKLGSFMSHPVHRLKDKVTVVELIKLGLPRELIGLDQAIKSLYQTLWDELAAEPAGPIT